jgi:hypothetical protein
MFYGSNNLLLDFNEKTYMVVEDVKLINPGENVIGGFVPLDKCYDSSKKLIS